MNKIIFSLLFLISLSIPTASADEKHKYLIQMVDQKHHPISNQTFTYVDSSGHSFDLKTLDDGCLVLYTDVPFLHTDTQSVKLDTEKVSIVQIDENKEEELIEEKTEVENISAENKGEDIKDKEIQDEDIKDEIVKDEEDKAEHTPQPNYITLKTQENPSPPSTDTSNEIHIYLMELQITPLVIYTSDKEPLAELPMQRHITVQGSEDETYYVSDGQNTISLRNGEKKYFPPTEQRAPEKQQQNIIKHSADTSRTSTYPTQQIHSKLPIEKPKIENTEQKEQKDKENSRHSSKNINEMEKKDSKPENNIPIKVPRNKQNQKELQKEKGLHTKKESKIKEPRSIPKNNSTQYENKDYKPYQRSKKINVAPATQVPTIDNRDPDAYVTQDHITQDDADSYSIEDDASADQQEQMLIQDDSIKDKKTLPKMNANPTIKLPDTGEHVNRFLSFTILVSGTILILMTYKKL